MVKYLCLIDIFDVRNNKILFIKDNYYTLYYVSHKQTTAYILTETNNRYYNIYNNRKKFISIIELRKNKLEKLLK